MKAMGAWSRARRLLVSLALTGSAASALAGERTIVIREQLKRTWTGQLVTYPFSAAPGECTAGSLALAGPDGPLPVQLHDAEFWPGTAFVRSGRIAFVVGGLKPLAALRYDLRWGTKPEVPAVGALQVAAEAGRVEMGTVAMSVRLPLGSQTFDPPVAADKAPAPVIALRAGTEPWFGGSRLYGAGRVKAWTATLVDKGPVFARVQTTYTYENGTVLTLRFQASTGENTLRVDMDVAGEQPDSGWNLTLNPAAPVGELKGIYGIGSWMRETAAPAPGAASDQPLLYLSPWAGDYWFPDSPQIVRLTRAGAPELQLCVRDVGGWVAPQERPPWGNFATWTNAWVTTPQMWAGWQTRRIPLLAAGPGAVRMQVSLEEGRRSWSMTSAPDGTAVTDTFLRKAITTHSNLPLLDEVKDMVLDWPDGAPEPPAGDAAAPVTADETLDKLGNIDLFRMNEGMRIFDHYRRIVGAAASPAQRRLHKAQMAYLAYTASDPRHWSFERGMCSGNPNMTVTRICNIGLFGLTLEGHPRGREWFEYANRWVRSWLAETVTDEGYWPESAHYTEVSLAALDNFASASARAEGYRVIEDPRYKTLQQLYRGRIATPAGAIVPYGRGVGSGLGGARQPDWTSEHVPHFGFILRSHAATPGENFLLYLPYRARCADGEIWPHQVASIASWYAAGKPVAGWHPGANTPPNWACKPHVQIDGVATEGTLAKTRGNGFALLPRADYISASFGYADAPARPPWGCHCGACPKQPKPFPGKTDDYAWTTQLLLAHDDKPAGVDYLVLRDTLDIDRASTWTFPAVPDALQCFAAGPAGQAGEAFRLQLPGAGAYYVALIPRSSGAVTAAAPGDGKVIRLTGGFGTDYCFLAGPAGDEAACGEAAFEGTAGTVRDRPGGLMLHLSAPGAVRYKEYALSGKTPAALRVAAEALTVSLSKPWPGGEVAVQAPGRWIVDADSQATLGDADGKGMLLRVPAGVRTVRLVVAPR